MNKRTLNVKRNYFNINVTKNRLTKKYYLCITKDWLGKQETSINKGINVYQKHTPVTPSESQGVQSVPLFYFPDYQRINIRSP